MRVHGLAGRYAHALYGAASKANQLQGLQAELAEVQQLTAGSSMARLFQDPFVNRATKSATVSEVLTKSGFSPIVVNFYKALAENARLNNVKEILTAFDTIMAADLGLVDTTSHPLSYANQARLTQAITRRFLNESDVVKVNNVVDKQLLGGFVVEWDGKVVDLTLKRRVAEIDSLVKKTISETTMPPPGL